MYNKYVHNSRNRIVQKVIILLCRGQIVGQEKDGVGIPSIVSEGQRSRSTTGQR